MRSTSAYELLQMILSVLITPALKLEYSYVKAHDYGALVSIWRSLPNLEFLKIQLYFYVALIK